METIFNNFVYAEVNYKLNGTTGWYEKQPEITPFPKLPFALKVEPTEKGSIIKQGAKQIITGRFNKRRKAFFTGLIPVGWDYFIGNDYEIVQGRKKIRLIVFEFSANREYLTINYFNLYYLNKKTRLKFVHAFIQDTHNKRKGRVS